MGFLGPPEWTLRRLTQVERKLTKLGPTYIRTEADGRLSFWKNVPKGGFEQVLTEEETKQASKILTDVWNFR